MADDHSQRPYRSNEPPARSAPGAAPNSGSDPLAELARLIGQNDPFAEFGRNNARHAAPPSAAEWSAPPAAPETPPAAPIYGTNDYYAASTAPAAQPAQEQPYGAPVTRQPYGGSPYAANTQLYHTENETPGYPAAAGGYQAAPYHPNQMQGAEEDDVYDDVPPPRRRIGVLAIAAVFALAVIGTAGAFGYRAIFGSSGANGPPPVIKADTAPSKIVPATANKTPSKLITDRMPDHPQDEKLVSREEKPVEVKSDPAIVQGQSQPSDQPAALGSGVIASEPKKVHTIAIRPDQLGDGQPQTPAAAPQQPPARMAAPTPIRPVAPAPRVASNPPPVADNPEPPAPRPQAEARAAAPVRSANAPLSLSPNANNDAAPAPAARPMRTASAPTAPAAKPAAPVAGGSYVQLSSQRSEADAQNAFRGLQAKYPTQLGNRQPVIRKVELGEKGTYFRAMIGPLAGNEATELCTGLKAAGGQCLIQRN